MARNAREEALLDLLGHKILVLELQGALFFGSVETIVSEAQVLAQY